MAIASAVCLAENSLAYALAGRRVGSQTVTHARLWFALPAMMLLHLWMFGSLGFQGMDLRGFCYLAASGLLGFCFTDMCIFKALVELGPRETAVVMGLTPIISAVLSWCFLAEHLAWVQVGGIVVTVSGVITVVVAEGNRRKERHHLWVGLGFALAGALLQAITIVLAKTGLRSGTHPVSANLVRLIFGFAGVTVVALLQQSWRRDIQRMKDSMALVQISTGAVIGPVIGMILALHALRAAPVGVAMALMQLAPIFLLPTDMILFKKRLGPVAIAGTLFAVAGTVILFANAGLGRGL